MRFRHEWGVLAALVLASTALRTWAALDVPVPWIAPDEMVYGLLGRSLYLNGSLDILGGPTPFYSALTPALAGFPLSAFGDATGHDVLQGLQAFAMSLAAVPVYLWGRSLVSRRSALLAAALTLAAPGLVYSGLVMTEVLFYPLLVLVAWAASEALARPGVRTASLLMLAVLAASFTRLQALVLVPVLGTAAFADAALLRSWANFRRLIPAAAGLGVFVAGWLGWRLASGSATLGGYDVVATTSYSVGDASRFVVYHLASVLILCGLFPACAVTLSVVRAARLGEPDPRVRAYLAVAVSLTAWFVVEVGVFASHYSDRIVERNLIGLGPILFIGLVVWLERGHSGTYVERSTIALAAAAVLLVLPVKRFVTASGMHDAMTLIPLYKLVQASSPGTLVAVYSSAAGAAAASFALLPKSVLRTVPVVLLVALTAASAVSSRFVAEQAQALQRALGSEPRWIDEHADGPVAYLYDGSPDWPSVWETLFWNRRVDRMYDLAGKVPGPLPQMPVKVRPDGTLTLRSPARRGAPAFAVVSPAFELVGSRVTQESLGLWRIDPPLRVSTRATGLQSGGNIYGNTRARLTAYGCTHGSFLLTLLIKQAQTIDLRVNGKLARRLSYPSPAPNTVWRGRVAAAGRGGTGTCTLEVAPTGLVGTTVFTFERS